MILKHLGTSLKEAETYTVLTRVFIIHRSAGFEVNDTGQGEQDEVQTSASLETVGWVFNLPVALHKGESSGPICKCAF